MIIIRSPEEIEHIRAAGRIVSEVLSVLCKKTVAGISTGELDKLAEEYVTARKGRPAFKGYKGYPATICTSVNSSIVHEIPSHSKILREGDIIGFDVGVEVNGYYADAAYTVGVGRISDTAQKLVEVTKVSLSRAIDEAHEGKRLSDISHAVQKYVEANGFSVVRHFVGHGIGKALHEAPEIPNFGPPDKGARLKEGMVLAIEPMVNEGSYEIDILSDGWTAVTSDRSLSAHFEHTVLVKEKKAEILT